MRRLFGFLPTLTSYVGGLLRESNVRDATNVVDSEGAKCGVIQTIGDFMIARIVACRIIFAMTKSLLSKILLSTEAALGKY